MISRYVLVLGVAIGNTPADASWDDAELADAGVWVAGNWLRIWIVASICVSTTGLFLADLATSIYQLEGMASMGMLPKFIGLKNSRGVPVVALVFQVIIVMALDQVCHFVRAQSPASTLFQFGDMCLVLRRRLVRWRTLSRTR